MPKHTMRERRKRHARQRRLRDTVTDIIRRGGELVCGSAAFAAIEKHTDLVGVFGGVPLRTSRFMPPNMIVAMRKNDDMIPADYRLNWIELDA